MENVLDELEWRGLVAETTDREKLREALNEPVTVYCGFDPTAASLHVGHLLQLIILRKLQRAGHHVLCLVGGATGLIGDPRPTAERVLKTKELTASYVESIQNQIAPFLDFAGDNPARMVNNLDWTAELTAIDFLRDLGKHFRVNQMLKKDSVAARMESQEGISFTEFSYQILQSNDYLHLFRNENCTLQTGAVDQWGNISAGVDLIRRVAGGSAHGLTSPLITTADGQKFGKSEGNAIWLDPELCSPYRFYQFWLNVEDAVVGHYLRVFTELSAEEIAELEQATQERPQDRAGQRRLADEITTFVHGQANCERVREASEAVFGNGDLRHLSEQTLRELSLDLPSVQVSADDPLVDVLVAAELAKSKNEARRFIKEGAISVNGAKVTDVEATLSGDDALAGMAWLIKRGKKNMALATR